MATLTAILIPGTVAIYLGFFLVHGETIFDPDFDVDTENSTGFFDNLFNSVSVTFQVVGDFLQFVTLGGFSSPLPGVLQAILLLSIGLGWLIVVMGLVRGTAAS